MGNATDCVILLIENGADVNIKDNRGNAPIYIAIGLVSTNVHYVKLLKTLIHYRANMNTKNNDGDTFYIMHVGFVSIRMLKHSYRSGRIRESVYEKQ